MARNITYLVRGQCPYTNEQRTIRVTAAEIHFIGSLTPGYENLSFSCNDGIDCGLDYECPLFRNANPR